MPAPAYWTPAAISADLPAGTVLPAWTPEGDLALWRSRSGALTAYADRCPHRGMRLSHGFVRGEALSCIYHGWSYGRAGNCLRIPAHPGLEPPETIRVATKQVAESGGIVWIAVGAPEGPPPAVGGEPLRSLAVDAAPETVEALAAAAGLALLATPWRSGWTLAHVLVDAASGAQDRIAASRAAEALRRRAEEERAA